MARIGFAVLLVAVACASSPKEIVERSVKAAGGEDTLASVQGFQIATEGTYLGASYTAVSRYREPDEWRWDMESPGMSMTNWVLDDEVFSSIAGGPAIRQKGVMRDYWMAQMRIANCALLPDRLLDPDVTIEKADKVVVDGRKCPAVRARFGEGDPVTYVFDPDTGLVRQVHFTMLEEDMARSVPAVMDLTDYANAGAISVAGTTRIRWGEGKLIEETVTDVRWNPDDDPAAFLRPEVAAPATVAVREEAETRVVEYTFAGPYDQTGDFVRKTMAWIASNGGAPVGPVAVLYREIGKETDYNRAKSTVQVPVKMASAPGNGQGKLLRRPPFTFCYAVYEGNVAGCSMLFPQVLGWAAQNGYVRSGPMRVVYLGQPDERGNVKAEVGFPVRRR